MIIGLSVVVYRKMAYRFDNDLFRKSFKHPNTKNAVIGQRSWYRIPD
jgi:hypothetical protein